MSKQLRAGTNELTVTVLNSNGPPALWLALDAGAFHLASDETWECSYADAVWCPARLASKPRHAPVGSAVAGGEAPWTGFRARWPTLLVFAALSAVIYWLVGRLASRPTNLAPQPSDRRLTGQSLLMSVASRLVRPNLLPVFVLAALWVALFANNLSELPAQVGFDVGGHLDYINYLQTRHTFPLAGEGWEMFQPPLYYLLGAVLLEGLGLTVADPAAMVALRLMGLAIGIAHLAIVWVSLRLLFPGEHAKHLWGLLLAAFLPPLLYLSQYVTNEGLAAALVSASFYLMLRMLKADRPSWKAWAGLGLCLGAALLTKSSALLAVPVVISGLLWKEVQGLELKGSQTSKVQRPKSVVSSQRSVHGLWSPAGRVALVLAVCAALCGWHYARTWLHYGTPLIGVWDPRTGFAWWQDDGYRTSAFYLRFGDVLIHPWFSGFRSFADGIYGTLWGDGLFGGLAGGLDRPPWNYDLMAVGYWLALPLTAAVLGGGVLALVRFLRQPRAEWLMVLGLAFLAAAAAVHFSLAAPYCCNVKAFYGLSALVPFCALAALGLEALAARSTRLRLICCVMFGVWAINSYASLWIVPASAAAGILRAKSLVHEGRKTDAAQTLTTLLQREPQNYDARAMLVTLSIAAGDGRQAAVEADTLARDNPDHAGAQLALAQVLALQGRLDQAAGHARRAMDLAPGDAQPYKSLAMLLARLGRYDEAAGISRAGLAVAPGSAELRFALGVALLVDGATNAAAQVQSALKLAPHLPGAPAILGSTLAKLGRLDEAAAQYSEALSLEPNNPGLHSELAMILAAAGKLDEAARHLSEALRFQPDNAQAHCQLGVVLGMQQQTAPAIEHYTEALRLNPDCAEALNNLAWIRAANPRTEFRNGAEAVRLAERACQLTEYKQPMLVGTLAAAYAEAGRFAEAVTAAGKARELALAAGQKDLAETNQKLIDLFTARQPYRDVPAAAKGSER